MAHTYYYSVDHAINATDGIPAPSSTGPMRTSNGYQDRWLDCTYLARPAMGLAHLYAITETPGRLLGPMLPSATCLYFRYRPNSDCIVRRVYELITFIKHDVFYNGAQADTMDMQTFVTEDTTHFVVPPYLAPPNKSGYARMGVFLMSGMTVSSNLVTSRLIDVGGETLKDHRLTIIPFDFEYQRVIRYLASVSGKAGLMYQFPRGTVPFCTRIESAPAPEPFLNAPMRNAECNDFPASLGYNDHVPVYDARDSLSPFNGDFLEVHRHLPEYSGDLPINSLVTVAFTASIWPLNLSCGRIVDVVGFYLQFVIIHAL
ncbi:hypothetical protein DFP72DRAFT_219280 [Ephemerocybe angulata]|uniref:Uncharacterized protein n=1 Tax=Ephemerocybe angulata TaxID=980116 RepID=A0A8H6LTD3_9AGAR|nr:hypothetical protein DFP72DRAFT_219280 [Tulosesus angulatus]